MAGSRRRLLGTEGGRPDPCPGLGTRFPTGTVKSDGWGQRDPGGQDFPGP